MARRSNLEKSGRPRVKILPQMKRYTKFGTLVLRRLDEGVCGGTDAVSVGGSEKELKREAFCVLHSFDDANFLPLAQKRIEKMGVPGLCNDL